MLRDCLKLPSRLYWLAQRFVEAVEEANRIERREIHRRENTDTVLLAAATKVINTIDFTPAPSSPEAPPV